MKNFLFAALLLTSGVAGCATADVASSIMQPANSPAIVSTLADAELGATLVTNAVDFYVTQGHANRATLLKINQLSDTVHAALASLEADRVAGRPLVFASYNSAVAAFKSYMQGLK